MHAGLAQASSGPTDKRVLELSNGRDMVGKQPNLGACAMKTLHFPNEVVHADRTQPEARITA